MNSARLADREGGAPEFTERCPALHESRTTWGLQSTRVDVCKHFGAGTRVCVLDSGVDVDHPDLTPAGVRSFTGSADVQDRVGHGTHCAGVIAGPRVPSRGPRYGVACDTELFVGKVFNTSSEASDDALIAGISWAVENRCDIVSMSFGVPHAEGYSEAFEEMTSSRSGSTALTAITEGQLAG